MSATATFARDYYTVPLLYDFWWLLWCLLLITHCRPPLLTVYFSDEIHSYE